VTLLNMKYRCDFGDVRVEWIDEGKL